jgi:hypothetical protein
MKWIAGVTAVLSLVAGLYQITRLVGDARERERQLAELHRVAQAQQTAGDYERAWLTLEQAAVGAEAGGLFAKLGGQLGEGRRRVREAQENLAMAWLENIRLPQGQTFSSVVDKLIPVLDRGIASASGARKADLLAHVGWAYFLKTRDGRSGLDPEQHYRQALEIDPANPYAHAYRGHWKVWTGTPPAAARREFAAAVASGRARQHVRAIQLAALTNSRSDESALELLRVVNEMRTNGEPFDPRIRREVYNVYFFAFSDEALLQKVLSVVPPAEQLATFMALFEGTESDAARRRMQQAFLAILQEAAGQPAEALRGWQAIRAELPPHTTGTLVTRANAAIKRLSRRSS